MNLDFMAFDPPPAHEDEDSKGLGRTPQSFAVVFLAPQKQAAEAEAEPKPILRVYPLGPYERAGEAACGILGSSRPEQLIPVIFPEPDRVLRFPVLIRPHDAARRGKPNPAAHSFADSVGLASNGLCPEGLWGPMMVIVPTEETAWLLVDFATAPEATRDSDPRYRKLFMYEVV